MVCFTLQRLEETFFLNVSSHGRLFSVRQAPALVFVMDTTGSMFEEITAARLRAHSIIQSRASSTGEPSSYVLVPFHDPSESGLLNSTFRNKPVVVKRFSWLM